METDPFRAGRLKRTSHIAIFGLTFGVAVSTAAGGCGSGSSEAAGIRTDAVAVGIIARDTSWQASYLGVVMPGGAADVASGREVHLPVGADVRLTLASRDYICLFAVPELGFRDFAAPGLPAEFHFRAERPGRYELRGDELCGLPHTEKTRGRLVVESPAAFRSWVGQRAKENGR